MPVKYVFKNNNSISEFQNLKNKKTSRKHVMYNNFISDCACALNYASKHFWLWAYVSDSN